MEKLQISNGSTFMNLIDFGSRVITRRKMSITLNDFQHKKKTTTTHRKKYFPKNR